MYPYLLKHSNTTLKRMKACTHVLGRIYESEYFDMGLLLKALENTWV